MQIDSLDKYLFGTYTYLERILWFIVNLLPKFFRHAFYKIAFGSYGKNVFIDEKCYFRYPWKIHIANDVTINRGCEFYPSYKKSNSKIELGQGVILGPRVVFFGAGQDVHSPRTKHVSDSIIINPKVYVGGNSTIRYGIEIGQQSVIGAGSVVVCDVPPNVIFAGSPARFKKSILR